MSCSNFGSPYVPWISPERVKCERDLRDSAGADLIPVSLASGCGTVTGGTKAGYKIIASPLTFKTTGSDETMVIRNITDLSLHREHDPELK